MRTLIRAFFLLMISYSVYGQKTGDLVLTKEQNEKWFDQLEKLDLTNQLSVIKNRALQDSCVYVDNTGYCGMVKIKQSKEKPKHGIKACHKPLLIFDGVPFDGKRIADFINEEEINEIKILKGPSAAALYGMRGDAGVILLTFKNKESMSRMKGAIVED
jgi:TonB-dependent SusC/RagA subfamily outer membrane receptor